VAVQLDGRALKLARDERPRLVVRDLVDPSQPATAINVLGQFRVPLGPHDVRAVEVNGNEKIRE
jgi:hypothetical protein